MISKYLISQSETVYSHNEENNALNKVNNTVSIIKKSFILSKIYLTRSRMNKHSNCRN